MTDHREPAAALVERARQLTGTPDLVASSDLVRAGLDSLGAMVLAGVLAEDGQPSLSAADVLRARTIDALMASLRRSATDAPAPEGGDVVPAAQLAIWLDDQLRDPADVANVLTAVFELSGPFDAEQLARALRDVTAAQPALRTALAPDAWGAPTAELLVADEATEVDVRRALRTEEVDDALAQVAGRVDLEYGPLLITDIHVGEPSYLLVAAHHCVMDGNGLAVLAEQASLAYRDADLPEPRPYRDFARESVERARLSLNEPDGQAWVQDLAGSADLGWPGEPGPPGTATVRLEVDPGVADALPAAAAAAGVTPFVLTLAAYAAALAEVCGQERFAVGVPMSAQSAPFARTIGCFVSCTPVVVDLTHGHDGLLPALQDEVFRAMAHQDVGLVDLVRRARPRRGAARPLVQAQLSWPDFAQPAWSLPGVTAVELPPPVIDAQFDLTLEMRAGRSAGSTWTGTLEHDTAAVSPGTVAEVGEAFVRHLRSFVG